MHGNFELVALVFRIKCLRFCPLLLRARLNQDMWSDFVLRVADFGLYQVQLLVCVLMHRVGVLVVL